MPSTGSCGPTASSPRSSRSATPSWSGTTSTAVRWPRFLRDPATVERLDLGTEVELTHLRIELTYAGALSLDADDRRGQHSLFGDGRGASMTPTSSTCPRSSDELNERFGLELDERDQLLFDQFEQDWLADPEVTAQAATTPSRTSGWSSTGASSRPSSAAWTRTTRSSSASSMTPSSTGAQGLLHEEGVRPGARLTCAIR